MSSLRQDLEAEDATKQATALLQVQHHHLLDHVVQKSCPAVDISAVLDSEHQRHTLCLLGQQVGKRCPAHLYTTCNLQQFVLAAQRDSQAAL